MLHKKQRGFSLIEMIIVLGLIGVIMSQVVPRVISYFGKAKVRTTQTSIGQIKEAMLAFELDMTRKARNLKELCESTEPKWSGPYYKGKTEDGIPVDAWGNPFTFNAPPQLLRGEYKVFEIVSFGETNDPSTEQKNWVHDGE